jgi:hypothetical protein
MREVTDASDSWAHPMKIEHVALQVEDPAVSPAGTSSILGWREAGASPSPFSHFLADDAGAVMIEVYRYHAGGTGLSIHESRCSCTSAFTR